MTNIFKAFWVEPYSYILEGLILAFTYIAVSERLAGIYLGLLLVTYIWDKEGGKLRFSNVPKNTTSSLVLAGFVWVVFLIVTMGLISLFQAGFASDMGMFFDRIRESILGSTGQQLLFEDNPVALLLLGGFVIARRETRALIALPMELLGKIFNVQIFKINFKTIMLFLIVSGIGVIFHWQAKGITDNVALTITFIFWFISCILISRRREVETATYLHVINNVFALIKKLF